MSLTHGEEVAFSRDVGLERDAPRCVPYLKVRLLLETDGLSNQEIVPWGPLTRN